MLKLAFVGVVAYVFFFQVKEVVDGFIHKLRATCDCHKVRVCSSTLGKPEINLKKTDTKPHQRLDSFK